MHSQPDSTASREIAPGQVLFWPIVLGSLSFGILAFALPVYARQLGASALGIGGLFSAFYVTTTLLRPLVGWGLDRIGRKPFFWIALLLYGASMFFFAYARSLDALYLARLMQGLGSSFLWISAYTLATEMSSAAQHGQAVGRVDAASAQGGLFGALAGFSLTFLMPLETAWFWIFAGYGVCALLAALLAWRRLPETRPALSQTAQPGRQLDFWPLARLMAVVFITNASMNLISPLLLIFLQDRFTTDVSVLAQAYIPAVLVYSFLPPRLGRLSDRFGRPLLIAAGLLAAGVVSLLIPGLPSLLWLVILWVLEAVGFSMASPAQEALVSDLTGSQMRGRGYGLYTFAAGLGATIGPLLGGWMYDRFGHGLPFYTNGLVLVLFALLIPLLFGGMKQPRPAERG